MAANRKRRSAGEHLTEVFGTRGSEVKGTGPGGKLTPGEQVQHAADYAIKGARMIGKRKKNPRVR